MENVTATPADHLAVLQKQGKLIVHNVSDIRLSDNFIPYSEYKLNRVVKKLAYAGTKGRVRILVDDAGNKYFSTYSLGIRGPVPRGHKDAGMEPRSLQHLIPSAKALARWDLIWPVAASKYEDARFIWLKGGICLSEQYYKWICKMHGRDLDWRFNGKDNVDGMLIVQDKMGDIVALLKPIYIKPDGKLQPTKKAVMELCHTARP